ncbi:MAG: AAA family ATPase [Erysipelotrichaceae bacterium]
MVAVDIVLNLQDESLFEAEEFKLEKKLTFVFGKNGTGKSTLVKLFQEQVTEYDVRVFQGFEGVIGENKRLNAVILGEENNEIENKIKEIELKIEEKNKEIIVIDKQVLKSDSDNDNLWARNAEKKQEVKTQKEKISDFYTKSASKIKNEANPRVSGPNYNKNNFQADIQKATMLSNDEIKDFKATLNITEKKARKFPELKFNLNKLTDLVNEKLVKKVNATFIINELKESKDKEQFAEKGMQIHKVGDVCSFCGNMYSLDRANLLKKYFSADEMEEFRNEINTVASDIQEAIDEINSISINSDDFYPIYVNRANDSIKLISEYVSKVKDYLTILDNCIEEKLKYMTESLSPLTYEVPNDIQTTIKTYNELVEENNKSKIGEQKENARNSLRYHKIKEMIDAFKLDAENFKLDELEKIYAQLEEDLKREENKKLNIETEINALRNEIISLRVQTKNEKKLADEINKKLKLYVNFELVHCTDEDSEGFYKIKCNRTSEMREIHKVSTGEKNIIAFLYFVEKLKEVPDITPKSRLIVFDDPMNSNDDTMQYVIIEELQNLFLKLEDPEKAVLLTHNSHFYINVKYKFDNYRKNKFLRLISKGKTVEIIFIEKSEDDFKTNYESFWKELKFLYNTEEVGDSMLLNPIRRIIETFSKFNAIDKKDMYSKVVGAEKLFNVNSHSIDDLEAELNGRNKDDIISLFKECFSGVNAEQHFNQHWESVEN